MGLMDGYIMNLYINTDANDVNSFQATVEKYKEMYGEYPKSISADAGYGSKKNYTYCTMHDIKAYIKYVGFEKEKEKVTEKNKYRIIHFERDENYITIYPAGYKFTIETMNTKYQKRSSK